MAIGEQIKKARQNRGYTQQELADILGVAKNTVTGYERGNRAPDALKIKAIAKALGVTGNWLMECEHEDELSPVASEEALMIARKYDMLDLSGQTLVRLVVDHETERVQSAPHTASEAALLQRVQAGAPEAAQPEGQAASGQS